METAVNIPLLDLSVSDEAVRAEILSKIEALVRASAFIGGKEVSEFEKEFGAYCGGGVALGVANGTDALIVALRALGVGPGDEVIVPPFTFIATAEAVSAAGARVRFADIDPRTYNLDPVLVEKAVTPRTKALIAVHLFGQAAEIDALRAVAAKHNLKIVEDAAQAQGAEYKGKRVGTLGDIAAFSFYPTKNLGAFGDAGALVSRSPDLIERCRKIANHGRSAQYFHDLEGLNSRLDALQAAVLRIKLRSLDAKNERRRQIAAQYGAAIRQNPHLSAPYVAETNTPVFHLYCLETAYRAALRDHLKDSGIASGVYYPLSLHLQPAYASLGRKKGDFPVSERVTERILAIPMYPEMTDAQVAFVADRLKAFRPR